VKQPNNAVKQSEIQTEPSSEAIFLKSKAILSRSIFFKY